MEETEENPDFYYDENWRGSDTHMTRKGAAQTCAQICEEEYEISQRELGRGAV